MPKDIMPARLEDVLDVYPWPKNEQGVPYSYFAHYRYPVERLSQEFKDILEQTSMTVRHAEIFFRPGTGEEFDAFIHTDGHKIVNGLAKINFVISNDDNIMRWYMPIVPVTEDHVMTTKVGTKYLNFKPEEVEIVDEVDLKGLAVVNAGIPHSVTMTSADHTSPRICISLVPRDKKTLENLGCNDAYIRLLKGFFKMGYVSEEYFLAEKDRVLREEAADSVE